MYSIIFTSWILIGSLAIINSTTITNLEGNPGIYFQYLGPLLYKKTNWIAQINIDLDEIHHGKAIRGITEISKTCNETTLLCHLYQAQTNDILHHLRIADKLYDSLNDTMMLHGSPNNYPSLVNLIEDDVNLIRMLNRDLQRVNNSTTFNRGYSGTIIDYLNLVQPRLDKIKEIIQAHIALYQRITQVIEQAQTGTISEKLFSHAQIYRLYQYIRRDSPFSLPTPDPLSKSFHKLFSCKIKRSANNVLIQLIFPVYFPERYNLYRLTPVPIPISPKLSTQITPTQEYMSSRNGSNLHFFYSEREMQDCTNIRNVTFCNQPAVRYDNASCELQTLYKLKPTNCRTDLITRTKTILIPLTTNNWIYSTRGDDNLSILCKDGTPSTFNISGVGLLTLSPQCQIQVTIQNQEPNQEHTYYEPVETLMLPSIRTFYFLTIAGITSAELCALIGLALLLRKTQPKNKPVTITICPEAIEMDTISTQTETTAINHIYEIPPPPKPVPSEVRRPANKLSTIIEENTNNSMSREPTLIELP